MSYNFKEVLNTYIIFRITVRNFNKPYLLVVAALEAVLSLKSTFFKILKLVNQFQMKIKLDQSSFYLQKYTPIYTHIFFYFR